MITINIIGCGRLGKTLAKLLYLHQAAEIVNVVTSKLETGQAAIEFIGQGIALDSLKKLTPVDVTFITTPDDKIKLLCDELLATASLKPGSLIVHCSGALSSTVLNHAQQKNIHIASVHLVRSFANPAKIVETFAGTYCTFEGDAKAKLILKKLMEKIGGIFIEINKEKKIQYHLAAVLANNYLVSLHYCAMKNFIAAGIEEKIAGELTSQLMQDALTNLTHLPHSEALTGPLKRNDYQTVEKHLTFLQHDEMTQRIYAALGKITLNFTPHNEEATKRLKKLLEIK